MIPTSLYFSLKNIGNTGIPPLSIGLNRKVSIFFLCFFLATQSIVGQISAPCGLTATVVNASSPAATDGKITITGLTGEHYYIYYGIIGSEMYTEMFDPIAPPKSVLTGLVAGAYTLRVGESSTTGWVCGYTSINITVDANSYPTCAGSEIGGFVFNDANANGIRDAGEGGAANVMVNAYNSAGTLVATQASNSKGSFSITGLSPGQPYRLEYSWADSYVKSGAAGSNSGTSVQFVNAGTCAANFGINYPANYCQSANPYVLTPCYINGDPQAAAVAPFDVLVSFPYKDANSDWDIAGQNIAPVHAASASQIGATWAVAYQKKSKYAFVGAVMRRYAGFGPLGTGGIYRVDMTSPTSPVTSNWVDLKTIGINTGNDTRDGTVANTLSSSPGTPAWDAEAYNQVGKVSIGGMDFNDRGDTLWLMNLADRKLYGIKNVNPSVTPTASDVIGGYTVALPSGYTCATNPNDLRPWAVKYYKGLVYVGMVCSGESTPWISANLHGYILSFNPANPAAGFSYVTDFPLDYLRQSYQLGNTFKFVPWLTNATWKAYYSQPILSDLEFDLDGSIIAAIADRGGLQSGFLNYSADPTATNYSEYQGNSYGDLLRFCKSGSSFVQTGGASCPNPAENPFSTSEYYWGDNGPFSSNANLSVNEISNGSITFLASSGSVLETVQDPYSWNSGGTLALSNSSGGDLWRYVVYDASSPGANGKATGLGDIELVCDPAPIEIGNRVWIDTDHDGIQDAGEPGAAGIQVQLYQGPTLVKTVTTDANGNFIFTGLLPNTSYQIRVALAQAAIGGKSLATANVGTNDLIDNDMINSAGVGIINLTTGYYGENDHTFDIGFAPICTQTVSAPISNNCTGAAALLTATGSSAGGNYSWTGLNGFTSSLQNPTIPNVQTSDAGAYTVVFTASDGCIATATTSLNVNPVISLTTSASNITECVGGTQAFNVVATGGFSPLTYQWQNSSTLAGPYTDIPTATSSSYTPPSNVAGILYYRVVISSSGGTGCTPFISNPTSATIVNDPTVSVTLPPANVCIGANVTLTATPVVGVGTCTVQWQSSLDGTTWIDIIGGTGNTYNANMTVTTHYRAKLISCTGNGCCN